MGLIKNDQNGRGFTSKWAWLQKFRVCFACNCTAGTPLQEILDPPLIGYVRSPKFMCFKSELLTLSMKQDMGRNIKKILNLNLKKTEIPTEKKWQIIRVGVSNFIKLDLRCDPKRMCY